MPTPSLWGSEFQANTLRQSGTQQDPAVTALTDGRLVYVWRDWGTSLATVRAQLVNADGSVNGPDFEVNVAQNAGGNTEAVAVAAGTDGGFAITWQFDASGATEGPDIYLATYDSAGVRTSLKTIFDPAAGEGANLLNRQYQPQIVAQPFGYTVVWTDDNNAVAGAIGINARDFNPTGGAIAGAYHISDTGGGDLSAALASFITFTEFDAYVLTNIVWDDNLSRVVNGPDLEGIFGNEIGYDPGGTFGPYQASGTIDEGDNAYSTPDTAYNGAGTPLNVWAYQPSPTGAFQIAARIPYGNSTAQFQVNTTTLGNGFQTTEGTSSIQQVAVAGNDFGFLVVWNDGGGPTGGPDDDVLGQLIDGSGALVGSEFVISTTALEYIDNIDVVAVADGRFVVTWGGYAIGSSTGSTEIFSQFVDPRTSAVNWVGNATNQNYAGTALADSLRGDGGNDFLVGFSANDTLEGGTGNDTLDGGTGEDDLHGGTGNDSIRGGDQFDNITGGDDDDSLYGDGGNDVLRGDAGDDLIDGGAGTDVISYRALWTIAGLNLTLAQGGSGSFTVAGDGTDTYVGIEGIHGTDTPGTAGDRLTGNNGANILGGFGGADTLDGGLGADTLDGGTGADSMTGGADNDTYVVDDAGDVVTEALNAGTDLVQSSISHTLRVNVENLTLTGTGNTNGTGNSLVNTLVGNSGNNILDGGTGADAMRGSGGNDRYTFDNAGDKASELVGEGTDTVISSVAHTLRANFENLTIIGTATNAFGSSVANILTGNGLNNILNGKEASDIMTGGAGLDTFMFDTALGAMNVDRITDFNPVDDAIRLDDAIFTTLPLGTLASGAFHAGTAAADAADRIIYDQATGRVFYDADGLGGTAQVLFALLDTRPLGLSNLDFVIT